MIEILIAIGIVCALGGVALLGAFLSWPQLLELGFLLTTIGLSLGVPTGFWYHVVLRRVLLAHGTLVPRWWMRPVAFHPRLTPAERRSVLVWFSLGAIGFVIALVGCGLAALGVLRGRFR